MRTFIIALLFVAVGDFGVAGGAEPEPRVFPHPTYLPPAPHVALPPLPYVASPPSRHAPPLPAPHVAPLTWRDLTKRWDLTKKRRPTTSPWKTFSYQPTHASALNVARAVDEALRTQHQVAQKADGLIVESDVTIVPDVSANSLIVVTKESLADQVCSLIEKADQPSRQVRISTRIRQIDKDGKETLRANPQLIVLAGGTAGIEIASEDGGKYVLEVTVDDVAAKPTVQILEPIAIPGDCCAESPCLLEAGAERAAGQWLDLEKSFTAADRALDKKISLRFDKAPLRDVLKHLSIVADVNVILDGSSVRAAGIDASSPVSIDVDDVPVRSALGALLTPLSFDFDFRDDILMIGASAPSAGTPQDDECVFRDGDIKLGAKPRPAESLVVTLYPVADFVVAETTREASETKPDVNFQPLIELISAEVMPETWKSQGGPGSITRLDSSLSLVVRHNEEAQKQIQDLLGRMRNIQAHVIGKGRLEELFGLQPVPAEAKGPELKPLGN